MKKSTTLLSLLLAVAFGFATATTQAQSDKSMGFIGTINSMKAEDHSMMLTDESGKEVMVMMDDSTVIVDEADAPMTTKDLKTAIKVRILGGGKGGAATKIIIMK